MDTAYTCQRIILPVKDQAYAEDILRILKRAEKNKTYSYLLLSVIPSPFEQDIPYSSIGARYRLQEQDRQAARMMSCLEDLRSKLQSFLPDPSIEIKVETGDPCAVILEQAQEWQASVILLASKNLRQSAWSYFQPDLSQQILQKADKTINVVKLPVYCEETASLDELDEFHTLSHY